MPSKHSKDVVWTQPRSGISDHWEGSKTIKILVPLKRHIQEIKYWLSSKYRHNFPWTQTCPLHSNKTTIALHSWWGSITDLDTYIGQSSLSLFFFFFFFFFCYRQWPEDLNSFLCHTIIHTSVVLEVEAGDEGILLLKQTCGKLH